MKKARTKLFYLSLVVFSLLLAACFSPWTGTEEAEKGTIALNLGADHSRSASVSQIQYTIYLTRIIDGIPGDKVQHGQPVSHAASINISIAPGIYLIDLEAKLNGHDYANGSTAAPVTVTAGSYASANVTMTMVFNILAFLQDPSFSGTPSDPILLPWVSQLTYSNWDTLLAALESSGKYVSLDLSAALRGGSGDLLNNTGVFDPRNNTASNSGKAQIVSLTLPGAAETIPDGEGAADFPFMDFTNLRQLDTGNGITRIGNIAYFNINLTSVIFRNTLEEIGFQAFRGNRLTEIFIPDSVRFIGPSAFDLDDNTITKIRLPGYPLEVGAAAFESGNLSEVTIGVNVNLVDNASIHLPAGFKDVYESHGQAAGVYIHNGTTWVKQ